MCHNLEVLCIYISDDAQKLRQLSVDLVNEKISLQEVKDYDFTECGGRGKRKKFQVEGSSSEDDDEVGSFSAINLVE